MPIAWQILKIYMYSYNSILKFQAISIVYLQNKQSKTPQTHPHKPHMQVHQEHEPLSSWRTHRLISRPLQFSWLLAKAMQEKEVIDGKGHGQTEMEAFIQACPMTFLSLCFSLPQSPSLFMYFYDIWDS